MDRDEARKQWRSAQDEASIMEQCERWANQIIGELTVSAGDHGEDVAVLRGLIEGWEALRYAHEETMTSIANQMKGEG